MHSIAVLALPDVIAYDVSLAIETFSRAPLSNGENGYKVRVCGTEPIVEAGPLWIATEHGLDGLADADTIIVPGRNDCTSPIPASVLTQLRNAYSSGTRIASICTGAFTVAAAGLLDGKRATTHWASAELFRHAFPHVLLDVNVLYVDEGQVLTSAGASAGLDLCLHMVQVDYGSAAAARAAKLAVAPLHRSGGQAQFVERNRYPTSPIEHKSELDGTLAWIEENAHHDLTLTSIAEHALTSRRTLNRKFRTETGQTPMEWVTGVRIRHAQELLERSSYSVERIGREVGFVSASNFRGLLHVQVTDSVTQPEWLVWP
ncbi:GlxA family transcriptional regulator [Rhodococcoides corynebacterioides]|uniref:GlxA family transcriptional regulator n=1 Tax=Rhodococcoides corynebacterioides TaxID=53972 RepID=UPI001C9AF8D3|nr:helix-turn-helix domain-containing protein [Rhodococcus corynebacterioides]MBY6348907.1 DJ-1/PfpI family protein [Rhodococcus corynebacterioides]